MKATFISKENNIAKFSVEFTAEEFEQAQIEVYKKNKHRFVVDGFRKGKAPRSIIEKHYGEGIFFEDAINTLFGEGYPAALKELELEVIDSPTADFSEIGKGKPLTITISVPVYPVVEVKDYFGVEIEQVEEKVSEEDVNREIEALQKRNSRMVVAERAVEEGDTVVLDYAGFVGEEQFEGGTAERQELKIGSGMFIPGFEEQLVGVNAGEEKDVVVTFPEEYHAPDLAGKEAVFKCKVHEVKFEELPELDDEFAKDVSEYDTLEELKAASAERLQKYIDAQSISRAKDAIIAKVCEANTVEAPAVMVEDEIDNMIQELDQQLRSQGLSVAQYMQVMQKDAKEFRDELRVDAEKKVATRLILMSIAEAEAIEVTEEDLEAELKNMAITYNMETEEVKNAIGAEGLKFFKKDIQLKKVIDLMYDKAVVTKVEAKDEE